MKRIAAVSLNAALMFGALACADRTPSGPDESSPSTPAGIVVSNPKAGSTTGNSIGVRSSLNVSVGTIVYVSAASGTFPDAESASIRNQTKSGAQQSVQVIDGGFDPVAVEAEAGDEISLRLFTGVSDVRNLTVKVPPRRPPAVVRTSPAKGRTDVALNVQIVVVFSEPVDPSSVTSAVSLAHDGIGVNGHPVVSADGLSVEFVPDSVLRGETTYSLTIDPGIRDLDGDTLGESSTTIFTTGTLPPAECPDNPGGYCIGAEIFVLVRVNDQPLPVKSPWGLGEWDYDEDAGTWVLTSATISLHTGGDFTYAVSHRAASGQTTNWTSAGRYVRTSDSIQFSPYYSTWLGNYTWFATIWGKSLIEHWPYGGPTFTFERYSPNSGE
jgi:hypothetical protein